ncbi:glucosamine-6-phosphate deaminase [Labedella phragmitis]|uniref:Glucosamine-6-phosphate deaminase n=1 Tax=Labedella phragmitis TaxID=2498849 RepID=A0A3S5CFI4_9MICO|nr:glucosamine-6-phosphate deaminase [Labedella phragmitis]RWZ53042.1 glucosamine-6-phosphate deaminase [Labedella phragmitis]
MISVHRFVDPAAVGRAAADLVDAAVLERGERVIGLATGSSPLETYAELVRRHGGDATSAYRDVEAFLLDEYIGLPSDHPQRYAAVIRREFTDAMGIPSGRVHGPDADAVDLAEASRAYDRTIERSGGVGVQLLGLGSDGHIAFNAPGTSFDERTHVATLGGSTRRDNARFFGGDIDAVPRSALSQGIATILRARSIVVIATGAGKAHIVAQVLASGPTEALPATALHGHDDVVLLVDAAAGVLLEGHG